MVNAASGHSEKHAETRKKQAKIALRLRGPAAPLLRKVAFLMQNVAKSPWYLPGVLHQNRGFLGLFGSYGALGLRIEMLTRAGARRAQSLAQEDAEVERERERSPRPRIPKKGPKED